MTVLLHSHWIQGYTARPSARQMPRPGSVEAVCGHSVRGTRRPHPENAAPKDGCNQSLCAIYATMGALQWVIYHQIPFLLEQPLGNRGVGGRADGAKTGIWATPDGTPVGGNRLPC